MDLTRLLEEAVTRKASDLHLVVGIPPTVRINGELAALEQVRLNESAVKMMIHGLLSAAQREKLERNLELNFALSLPTGQRFRVTVYYAKGNVEAAFRAIGLRPQSWQELGLPPIIATLSRKPGGLILLTSPAGHGKTTTMAAMIHLINQERRCRVVTIEDPIEYLHQNLNSVIIQREVGEDTRSFHSALVQVLRQDPDVICVGEMRDLETISTALTAAETGHLVLATLHTPDAPQCINRIVDVFPAAQQEQIRYQMAAALEGVIAQRLVPRIDRPGRAVLCEVLVATAAVRNLIRENRIDQLSIVMETGSVDGMVSWDRTLREMLQQRVISQETAIARARRPEVFKTVAAPTR